jgi:long-chain fatty acid transport protein
MKTRHRALGALCLATTGLAIDAPVANAAGIERVAPSTRVLFRDGNYVEFNLAYVSPDLSGTGANLAALNPALPFVPGNTGNLFDSYTQFSLAYKGNITERISFALILDEPYGADTDYGQGSFPGGLFSYAGSTADLNSYQLSGILAYDVTPQVKLYAGVRAQRTEADASIPFIGLADPLRGIPYTVSTDKDWGYGYLVGGAYQMPEIALRVALTYHSKISHSFDTLEYGQFNTRTDMDTPQSVTLEFQSGVAEDTLVFGSVRWVDWSDFRIAPPQYVASLQRLTGAPRALVDYESDWWTYTLGVGRQITDEWSGAVSVLYEPQTGDVLTTLGPVDGRTALTGSATYTMGAVELTGGLTYGWLGDTSNLLQTRYRDGDYWGLGLRVGYAF